MNSTGELRYGRPARLMGQASGRPGARGVDSTPGTSRGQGYFLVNPTPEMMEINCCFAGDPERILTPM